MRSKQSIIFLECVHLPYPYFCYFPWFSRSKHELLFHFRKISTFIETIYSAPGQRERLQISRDPYYLTITTPCLQEAEGAAAAAEPRQHAHRLLPRRLHRPPLLRSATPYIPICIYSHRAVIELSRTFSQWRLGPSLICFESLLARSHFLLKCNDRCFIMVSMPKINQHLSTRFNQWQIVALWIFAKQTAWHAIPNFMEMSHYVRNFSKFSKFRWCRRAESGWEVQVSGGVRHGGAQQQGGGLGPQAGQLRPQLQGQGEPGDKNISPCYNFYSETRGAIF